MNPMKSSRTFSLPENLNTWIQSQLGTAKPKDIAVAILKMSDFYNENPFEQTPWNEKWCQQAQIGYFLPLNFLRSMAVAKEASQVGFPLKGLPLVDFGSGLGAGHLPWSQKFGLPLFLHERSSQALRLNQDLLQKLGNDKPEILQEIEMLNLPGFTAMFSYSLTELQELPDWALKADNLILIEPSTRDDGRKLLGLRDQLIQKKYSIWAPCPHQSDCPLLTKSKTDWCHDRIHLEMPTWFSEIEKHLPMKNRTITFSYILASRKPAPKTEQWRLIGDSLEEKGKTRQMVCRNSEREFLAWMHRNGEPPEWPRGILIDPPADFEIKSNELRLK